ncbi:ketopantoate reductase family protein [Dokdonella sp.]|uniref:ketopantoate reductase family protein n=1 Tax=Dokdonella sp. TaxID=2291710 RepID=UPI001B05B65F|nr:ketopantoate reductase family protein [Dokdonella sp.]MBO9662721.1 ketopantoate reductase family protein [Dokdonella sp.]
MRILILGAGAIGGYFGARLIEAGVDVTFLVRPARAALLAEHGLRVFSARGDVARPVRAISEVDGAYDLVLLSCKAYDLDSAIAAIRPAVGAGSLVLPLLNGLRHLDALDAAFGAERVLGGLCHISVTLEADGAIRQFGALERLTYGRRQADLAIPAGLDAALRSIGPQVTRSDAVLGAMWDKFAFIAALAGGTCLLRGAVGEIVATAEGADLMRRLHGECAEVAARSGHPLGGEAIDAALGILAAPGSPLKSSMLRDLERGARTEGEHILGDLRRRAIAFGVDTPLLAAALTHVRVYEAGREANPAA